MSASTSHHPAATLPGPRPRRRARHLGRAAVLAVIASGFASAPALAADTQAPSAPGAITLTPLDFGSYAVSWGPSTDDVGVTQYVLRAVGSQNSGDPSSEKVVDGTTTHSTFSAFPIGPTGFYGLSVVAKDAAGNTSAPSPVATTQGCGFDIYGAPQPAGLTITDVTATSATFSWTPTPARDWCTHRTTGFEVSLDDSSVRATVGPDATRYRFAGVAPGTTHDAVITSLPKPNGGGPFPSTPRISFTTATVDTTPPTKVTGVSVHQTGEGNRALIGWTPSSDDTGVTAYDVYAGKTLAITVPGTATSAQDVLLPASPHQPITVVARDAAGNASEPSDPITVNTCGPTSPPRVLAPTGVSATQVTATGATVSWTPSSTDGCGIVSPRRYTVYATSAVGGAPQAVGSVTATADTPSPSSVAITGLSPATTYALYVTADGGVSGGASSTPIQVTTGAAPVDPTSTFAIRGSVTLKNLAKGSVPLTGSVKGSYGAASGEVSADLALNGSTANLVALGFLPVTATVNLASTAPLTGQLTGASLTATAKFRVKLPSLKVFGVSLGGGATCQAAQISTVALKSTGAFTPGAGGTLAGSFAISNLTGCGVLNGVVSPLTAGSGNAIALTLTPAA
ncbi:MAG: fibronectin type III domain-containing protein [Solirubrobacteraceae bacterium]|nr:fibronectin type III domain-containing protein [Patulibacter sp.]